MDSQIHSTITYILSHIPLIMWILALVIGIIIVAVRGKRATRLQNINSFLAYLFLLAVGISGIWGFVVHCFFGQMSAQFIGWQPSPFQFEVGIANLAMGALGIFAFRASQGFRAATTLMTTVFLWGAAAGHIYQMVIARNFAPGNAGAIFYTDILIPLTLIILMLLHRSARKV